MLKRDNLILNPGVSYLISGIGFLDVRRQCSEMREIVKYSWYCTSILLLTMIVACSTHSNSTIPLAMAAKSGKTATVKKLLHKGADINAQYKGMTPLLWATVDGRAETVKVILESGADINARNNNGYTALIVASMKGYADIVEVLLENGAGVNLKDKWGKTALIWAKEKSNDKIIELFKKAGANIGVEKDNTEGKKSSPGKFTINFSPSTFNTDFLANNLEGKVIIILPTRSSISGSGSDEPVTNSLNKNLRKALNKSRIITDNEMDKYFTDNDTWDNYFSYIANYSEKGISHKRDLEQAIKLYAAFKPDYIAVATSDPFMLSAGSNRSEILNLYIDLQIWDLNAKQRTWGGTCSGETLIYSKNEKEKIYQKLADLIAQRIARELINEKIE